MKIFKDFKYFLICFFMIIFETTVGKYLAVSGTVPMLSFSLCLAIAAKEENVNYILTVSIAMGVILDLLSGHGFGSYTTTFVLAAYCMYFFRDSIFTSKTLFLVCATFILTILFSICYYLFHILHVGVNFGIMLSEIALPTAIYNVVLSVAFYWILNITLYKRR